MKSNYTSNESKGFIYAFIASFFYSTLALIAKLAYEAPSVMIVFFRNLICLLLLLPSFNRIEYFKTKKIGLFVSRMLMGFLTLNAFYFSAKHLLLVDSVMLINTAPLFIPIILFFLDKKRISKRRLMAITLGFIGVILILKPKYNFFNFYGLIGLSSGFFMALSMIILRKLSKTEPTKRILFYFFLGNVFLGFFPTISSFKTFEDSFTWVYLILVGVLGFIFQFFTTKAYTHTHPTRVSSIAYFAVIFSGFLGFLIYKNLPDIFSIIGSIIIIFSGIVIINEKEKLNLPIDKSRGF